MESDRKLPLGAHLVELRNRLLAAVAVVMVFGVLGFVFSGQLIALLEAPLPAELDLTVFSVLEAFFIKLKVGFLGGFIAASPVVLWIFWGFISPGLTPEERRAVGPILPVVMLLFVAGSVFTWWLVLPRAIPVLLGFAGQFDVTLRVDYYIGFAAGVVASGGLIFEIPVLMVTLRKLGLIDAAFLWRYFRHAIVVIVVLVAVLTPTPDAINLTILALPTILLYLLSIFLVARVKPVGAGREDNED